MIRTFACRDAITLNDVVELNARVQPEALALVFDGQPWTYGRLKTAVDGCAAQVWTLARSRSAARGFRVTVVLDNKPEFFVAFFGVLKAGGVVVSVSTKSKLNRLDDIIRHSESSLLVSSRSLFEGYCEHLGSPSAVPVGYCDAETLGSCPEVPSEDFPPINPDDLAFFQYTSGTTGSSKGVMISHRAALANLQSLGSSFRVSADRDVFTSMMPLYHDMGLIGFGLYPLYSGCPLVLFLQDIRSIYSWLESFSEYRATVSGASNTMLHLTRRVVADPTQYDLSSLKILVCGSEPLFAKTLQDFETDYRVKNVLVPAYGLAEATLCLTLCQPATPVRVDDRGIVSCGVPIPGVRLVIDEPDARGVGEVLAGSPALMKGYFKADGHSELWKDGLLRTGDLGYVGAEGELYILGRKKNILIRDGENFLPGELEEIALRFSEVRNACVVAIRHPSNENRERIVLVVEVKQGLLLKPEAIAVLHRSVLKLARQECNYLPDKTYYVPPVTIPFSPNGKLQHQRMRTLIEEPGWASVSKIEQ